MIDEFKVESDDAIVSHAFAADDRDDAQVVTFTLNAQERPGLDIE